ncbi:MAG: helix-turn-helix transcriptional regulator [Candidatus Rokubacteria bacterium]|nr:helix-turn-helix transcriptional regulator [Candidatus Rokubacteria bacterium]
MGQHDFLRLSTEEAAYVDLKVRLATGLHERRRRSLTQEDLAKRLQSSQPRIAKMEAGDPSVSLDLLIRSLLIEKAGLLINLTQDGQLEMRELVRASLRRIEWDPKGLPLRLFPFTRRREPEEPRSVSENFSPPGVRILV